MDVKKLLAEAFGTFILCFTVLLCANTTAFPIPVPVMAGLVVGIFVYTVGSISGCHLNPAVTIGLFSINKIKAIDAALYLISQVIGALLALLIAINLGNQITELNLSSNPLVLAGELLGTAILTFGIASVVFGKVSDGAAGAVIGGSLTLGAFLASLIGAPGFLNPAVALASESLTITTLIGPLIGGIIGFQFYKVLVGKN
jgi:aquaporin Z